jgi:hypothetical protein
MKSQPTFKSASMGSIVVPGAKEPIMTAMVQTEKPDLHELSLEDMEQVSGGEFMNPVEWIATTLVCMACLARGAQIAKGPLT